MRHFNYIMFINFFIFLSTPLGVFAQDKEPANSIDELSEADLRGMTREYDKNYDDIEGSPFFYQAWLPGKVTLENGSTYDGIEVLYDVHNDEVLIRKPESESVSVIDKNMVKSFHLGSNSRANMANFFKAGLLEADLPNVADDKYVQMLYEGDGFLFAMNHKNLKNQVFSDLEADYLYIDPEGKAHELKPNKEDVLNTFSDKREAVADYIDGRDLDLSQRDDLVEVVMFYTTEVN